MTVEDLAKNTVRLLAEKVREPQISINPYILRMKTAGLWQKVNALQCLGSFKIKENLLLFPSRRASAGKK